MKKQNEEKSIEVEVKETYPTLVIQIMKGTTIATAKEVRIPEKHMWKEIMKVGELSVYDKEASIIFFVENR